MKEFVNVQEAKANLSKLLAQVEAGEDIVIARSGRPVARLVPVDKRPNRILGFIPGTVSDEVLAPNYRTLKEFGSSTI